MTKRHDVDSGGSSDGEDEGLQHDDKVALRRARNREAARRVRERRLNTIRTLSDQVEQLTAENQRLKDLVSSLQQGETAGHSSDPAPRTVGHEQQQEWGSFHIRPEVVDAAVQTEGSRRCSADDSNIGPCPVEALEQVLHQPLHPNLGEVDSMQHAAVQLLQQLQQVQHMHQQQQQVQALLALVNGGQVPAVQTPSNEALQVLLQLQAMLPGSLPPTLVHQQQQQLQQQQLVEQLQQQIQAALHQQMQQQQHGQARVRQTTSDPGSQACSGVGGGIPPPLAAPQDGPCLGSGAWGLPAQGSGRSAGSARAQLPGQPPGVAAQGRPAAPGCHGATHSAVQRSSSTSELITGGAGAASSSRGAATLQGLFGMEPPGATVPATALATTRLPAAAPPPPVAAAAAAAAAAGNSGSPPLRHAGEGHGQQPAAAADQGAAPMSTGRNAAGGALGDEQEPTFMSTDMTLLTSDFNLMMSEELLRHVPLPDEAAAQGNTAWL